MLPYFGVAPNEESKIDKSSFISKTKAALSYYEENVNLNVLYYLGDNITKDYPNHEGSVTQKNDAHFLEIAAALSIIDFVKIPSTSLPNDNGVAQNPIFKEFGLKDNSQSILFENLGTFSQAVIKKNLTQYHLFVLYLRDQLVENLDQAWTKNLGIKSFITQPFYNSYLKPFNQFYNEWLSEMSFNQRSFNPFNLQADNTNLFEMVKGTRPKTAFLEKGGKNYNRYNYMLGSVQKDLKNNSSPEQRFMDLFYTTTDKLVTEKYNF